jgi:hypothetical protein
MGLNYLHGTAVFVIDQDLTPPGNLSGRSVSKTKVFCTSLAAQLDRHWLLRGMGTTGKQ